MLRNKPLKKKRPEISEQHLKYSLVQWNWFSGVTGCMWLRCIPVTSENQFHRTILYHIFSPTSARALRRTTPWRPESNFFVLNVCGMRMAPRTSRHNQTGSRTRVCLSSRMSKYTIWEKRRRPLLENKQHKPTFFHAVGTEDQDQCKADNSTRTNTGVQIEKPKQG